MSIPPVLGVYMVWVTVAFTFIYVLKSKMAKGITIATRSVFVYFSGANAATIGHGKSHVPNDDELIRNGDIWYTVLFYELKF